MMTYRQRCLVALPGAAFFAFLFASPSFAQSGGKGRITITIDITANRHPISPLIYGSAYADDKAIRELRLPLHRMGGNNTSRYNWQQNADNRGNDWFFESIGDSSPTPGERGDTFIARSKKNGSEPMMTIPMVGYVARIGSDRSKRWSYSVKKYGAQQHTDQYAADAGNGNHTDGKPVTGNDPLDANIPANAEFQRGWVRHIVQKFGSAKSSTGLRYYLLDNEPGIWHSTHRDVHPVGATMEEVRDKSVATATMVKLVDPAALVAGPEEWGWSGYLYSGYDAQWGSIHGWGSLPEKAKHNNKEFVAWYLAEMRDAGKRAGKRLLDLFTLHIYPQGGEFGDDVSDAMQERRNRSTRALFDPTYKDETWINDTVRLIPRMKDWVANNYPGTRIGITEYNWGAEKHINGATAQADIYGIFGREGLDVGTRWTTPPMGSPTYAAMRLFRNYDGKGSGFGNTSVAARTDAPYEALTAYAATRSSDGATTIVVVNKGVSTHPVTRSVTLHLSGLWAVTKAQTWQINSGTGGAIQRLADAAVSHNAITLSLPAPSVTLIVVPKR